MNMKDMGWNLNNSYLNLPERFYSKVELNPVSKPELIIFNDTLGKKLGLNIENIKGKEGISILAGNKKIKDTIPIAQAYGGHQFGHFTMLGDGRAILLGEQRTPDGDVYDIQLKGAGRTPYSRGGDGRAGVGPMLREYIISHAMNNLKVPTTGALAVIKTGDKVIRERPLSGAVLTRIASSHIRVGTFQYANTWGNLEDLKSLADYSIDRHFPHIISSKNSYIHLLEEVIKVQAKLISKWQLIGFIHGVMNTDNMTISGEGIDYGPCAFMDVYDPKTVFSSIDRGGRYAYMNQPGIGQWNLFRFAESLLPLIHKEEDKAVKLAEKCLKGFSRLYNQYWLEGMGKKLGIFKIREEDKNIIIEVLKLMARYKADYTNTFVELTLGAGCKSQLFSSEEYKSWHKKWEERLSEQKESKLDIEKLMKSSNPAIIPRNYIMEEALKAAEKGNYDKVFKFIDVLSSPYDYSKDYKKYGKTPEKTNIPYKTFCGT